MKLVIAKDGVKRSIEAPFDLCLGRDAAQALANQLRDHLSREDWSYGWLRIRDAELIGGPVNSTPRPWVE